MFTSDQITAFLIKCAWVAGAFVAGFCLTWLATASFDRLVTKRKSPELLHKWARVIGGITFALVVGFLLFPGGPGTGVGGTGGTGKDGGDPNPTAPENAKPTPAERPPEVGVNAVPVRVTVYAGNAVERGTEKFFKVGTRDEMVNVEGVRAAVQANQSGPAGVVIVYTLDAATAAPGTSGFTALQAEAKALKVPLVTPAEFEGLKQRR